MYKNSLLKSSWNLQREYKTYVSNDPCLIWTVVCGSPSRYAHFFFLKQRGRKESHRNHQKKIAFLTEPNDCIKKKSWNIHYLRIQKWRHMSQNTGTAKLLFIAWSVQSKNKDIFREGYLNCKSSLASCKHMGKAFSSTIPRLCFSERFWVSLPFPISTVVCWFILSSVEQ